MEYSLYINQAKSLEWGLNLQQACLFGFLHSAPAWAEVRMVDGEAWFWVSKQKILSELPILTDKQDTVKRHMSALEKAGVIERRTVSNEPVYRITTLGKDWNKATKARGGKKIPTKKSQSEGGRKIPTSPEHAASKGGEINPDQVGKNIPSGAGKKSPSSREKNPPNHIYQDQYTNDQIINYAFDEFWSAYDKKVGSKSKLERKWIKLSAEQRAAVMAHVPKYVVATPDKRYRKNPETYLNNESWNDEILPAGPAMAGTPSGQPDYATAQASLERLTDTSW